MFKIMKAQAKLLGLGRLPLRVHAQAHHDPYTNIQKVRFYKPFRAKRLFTSILTVTVGYALFVNVVFAPLDKLGQELEKEQARQGILDEEEEDDDSIFLPFPGTIRQMQPKPYKGSDPEWMEFVKFSKSNELNKKVRDDLAHYVLSICERNQGIKMRIGKNIKLRRYWLDIDYPHSPPPEFERSGIEISDNHISWITTPVDSLTVFRLKRILWPSAVTQSFWSFWKVLFIQDSEKLAGLFSADKDKQRSQRTFEEIIGKPLKRPPNKIDKPEPTTNDDLPNSTSRNVHAPKAPELPNPSGPSSAVDKPSDDQSKSPIKTSNKTELGRVSPTNSGLDLTAVKLHMLRALMAFQSKFAQTWRATPNYPPRGSLYISGLVELDTPRAWVVVDVKAAWDPKTRTFDERSMVLQFRRLQYKKQPPRGGV